jgi:hypothetical protein
MRDREIQVLESMMKMLKECLIINIKHKNFEAAKRTLKDLKKVRIELSEYHSKHQSKRRDKRRCINRSKKAKHIYYFWKK